MSSNIFKVIQFHLQIELELKFQKEMSFFSGTKIHHMGINYERTNNWSGVVNFLRKHPKITCLRNKIIFTLKLRIFSPKLVVYIVKHGEK